MMTVAAAALGCASCSETWDGNPVLKTHDGILTEDFLNKPVLQDQYIQLTEDSRDGSFHLTCSQPDFGYAAIATYKVQVSLTEDFARYEEISQGFFNCAEINPLNHDMASSIEKLYDVTTEDDLVNVPDDFKIYVRLRAYIAQDEENTQYLSNPVYFSHVSVNYLAVWISGNPVDLYLRGGFNNWDNLVDGDFSWQFKTGPAEQTWVLYVDEAHTIPANSSIKVSTATWGSPNLGGNAGENDDSQMIEAGTEYAMTMGDNPGHMRMDKPFYGEVVLRLENGVYYITFEPAEAE